MDTGILLVYRSLPEIYYSVSIKKASCTNPVLYIDVISQEKANSFADEALCCQYIHISSLIL